MNNESARTFVTKMTKQQMVIFFIIAKHLKIKMSDYVQEMSDMDRIEDSYPYVVISDGEVKRYLSNLGWVMLSFGEFIDYILTLTLEIKLNNQYSARIEGGKVKVGCQTFEFSAIDELYNAIHK